MIRVAYRLLYLTRPYLRGSDVLAVQTRLLEAGYDPYGLDGVFGPLTENAVAAFQRGHGLDPTGVVDRTTYLRLGFDAGEAGPEPTPDKPVGRPGAISISVSMSARQVTVYSASSARRTGAGTSARVLRVYPCAVGKPSTPSPRGDWQVVSKVIGPDWPVLGTRWMGLDVPWANYGLHGTNNPSSIGQAISNGCIRLHNHNVEELFDWAEIGTPVKISER